jgi:hypothetical protein
VREELAHLLGCGLTDGALGDNTLQTHVEFLVTIRIAVEHDKVAAVNDIGASCARVQRIKRVDFDTVTFGVDVAEADVREQPNAVISQEGVVRRPTDVTMFVDFRAMHQSRLAEAQLLQYLNTCTHVTLLL